MEDNESRHGRLEQGVREGQRVFGVDYNSCRMLGGKGLYNWEKNSA